MARNPNKPSTPVGNVVARYKRPFAMPSFNTVSSFAVFKPAVIIAVFNAVVAIAVNTFKIVPVLSLCVLH